jgi:hypothetical protein
VPRAKLEVAGNVYVSSGNIGVGTSVPQAALTVGSTGQFQVSSTGVVTLSTDLTVSNGGTGASTLTGVLKGNGASAFTAMTGTPGYHTRWSDANTLGNALIYDNGTNIGIGSTVPQAKLDIEGSVYVGNGNIGVGSSAPAQKLDVIGTVDANAFIGDGSGLTGLNWTRTGTNVYVTTSTDSVGIGSSVPRAKLEVAGNVYVSGGNVGIGSSAPLRPLDVVGVVYFNGNVGIGSTAPRAKLDVVGTGSVSTLTMNKSTFMEVKFGSGAGAQQNFNWTTAFTKVNFHSLSNYSLTDNGGNYSAANDWYVCPVSGIYMVITKIRVTDSTAANISYGQGAGTSAADSPTFLWQQTFTATRNGSHNVLVAHFNSGDQVRMFAYANSSIWASDGDFQMFLLTAD